MRSSLLLLFIPMALGCTHTQLRKHTIQQAQTLTDIYQQQVLDNLAMFVADPHSLPHFATPNSAVSQVKDRGASAVGIDWLRSGFSAVRLGVDTSREQQGSWTLTPIRDPHKLALMRCAYQKALATCGLGRVSTSCPDCRQRFQQFYTGHRHSEEDPAGDGGQCCLEGPCWFACGCKKCLPKLERRFVGRHGDVFVWVPPGPGRDELVKLTMAILDYAIHEPESLKVTKKVRFHLDQFGNETTPSLATRTVEAIIPIDQPDERVLTTPLSQNVSNLNAVRRERDYLNAVGPEDACWQERMQTVSERENSLVSQHVALATQRCLALVNRDLRDSVQERYRPTYTIPTKESPLYAHLSKETLDCIKHLKEPGLLDAPAGLGEDLYQPRIRTSELNFGPDLLFLEQQLQTVQ